MHSDAADRLAGVPEENFPTTPEELHAEVMELATREVWQSCGSFTREAYDALELDAGWHRVGIGRAAMDAHCFRRSPGADADGPVRIREIGGRDFFYCARPASAPERPAGPDGPTLLQVDKHHTVVFDAGRSVNWLTLPDGRVFVQVIASEPGAQPLALPDGWRVDSRPNERQRVLDLPAPTTVFFFPNGASFQGPFHE